MKPSCPDSGETGKWLHLAMKEAELETLMKEALAGDRQSYADLLRETSRFLKPYLSLRLKEEHEVDDVLQEILISIHKARHTYDGNRPYKPWAYAIAKFRLQDHFRARYGDHLHQAVELSEIEESLADPVTENAFTYESIRGEIEKLPEKQAAILTLMHREGYTSKEVAERMGMNESAVKVAAHRAYKLLRKKLEQ
ncbi:MAG TPA: sigma-70 family RNA polymerase sigma factor [Burkholderiales bacterium]|nr:sigma-70 family RNA polymerase sigma factor [Burkholderiales bacterium]